MFRGAATVFVSGLAVMILELVAGRLVAPFYGQSTRTWAALTGVTLAGVTLGNALGGFLSSRMRQPLRIAAFALALGGAYAAVLPFALPAIYALVSCLHDPSVQTAAFVLTAWLPMMLALGCVTPSVAAAFVRAESNGRDLGLLYSSSMIGSAIGSTLGGLLLPFVLPADTLYLIFGAILLIAAGFLFIVRAGATSVAGTTPSQTETSSRSSLFSLHSSLLILSVFVVGWFGMGIELAGARLVTPLLGGNHVVWSLIFITFIGAMGVGGMVGGTVADRFPRIDTVVYSLLALAAVAFGTVSVETNWLPKALEESGPIVRLLTLTVVAFAPLAFTLGAVSTIVLKFATADALARGDRSIVGFMYASSAAGCVCGTFITGFFCVGRICSTDICLLLVAAIILVALLIARASGANRENNAPLFWSAAVFAALAALGVGGRLLTDKAWTDGLVFAPSPIEVRYDPGLKQMSFVESQYNAVTVSQMTDMPHVRQIWLDRIQHTVTDMTNRDNLRAYYTRMIDSIVGVNIARRLESPALFMIGGGGYALPRKWTQGKIDWRRLVVAEIDKAVQDAALRYLDAAPIVSNGVWYATDDGRRVADQLLEEGEAGKFDIAVGDTISDSAIPYHLVTKEFNDRIKSLLKPNGIYLLHTLDKPDEPALLASLVKTLAATYRHVGVLAYQQVTDIRQSLIVVASDDPAQMGMGDYVKAVANDYPESYPRSFEGAEISRLAARDDAILLTDRFSPVERFVWDVVFRASDKRIDRESELATKLVLNGQKEEAFELITRLLADAPEFHGAIHALMRYLEEYPEDKEALNLLKTQAERKSFGFDAQAAYASILARRGDADGAERLLRTLRNRFPRHNAFAKGWLINAARTSHKDEARQWFNDHKDSFQMMERVEFEEMLSK